MDANSSLGPVPLTVPSVWHARPLRWAKHEDVLLAGQPSRSIYVNQDGWFARHKLLHDGSRQIVDFVLPGEMFGLQACVFKSSLYTVTAITPGTVSGAYQLSFGCGAAGPGGWVARDADSAIHLEGGSADELDINSVSGVASMLHHVSAEIAE